MPKLMPCKTCGGDVSSAAKTCPHCGQKLKSNFFVKVIKTVGVILFLIFIIALFIPEDLETSESSNDPDPVAADANSQAQTTEIDPRPTDQILFLTAIADARSVSREASNDMQRGAALASRSNATCDLLPADKRVKDWFGTIYSIDANSEGKGVLVVTIADGVWVSTWNNAFSDVMTNTLIEPDTALFGDISSLSKGDNIVFSGEFFTDDQSCVSMQNFALSGKIDRPEFVFRFSSVSPAK